MERALLNRLQPGTTPDAAHAQPVYRACIAGTDVRLTDENDVLSAYIGAACAPAATWRVRHDAGNTSLIATSMVDDAAGQTALAAALEMLFCRSNRTAAITLKLPAGQTVRLRQAGLAIAAENGDLQVHAGMFWQQAHHWLSGDAAAALPLHYRMSDGKRHPWRATKPQGTVYRRYIPWLQASLSFRRLEVEPDLAHFNRWMNDPVVAHFWQETGSIAQHRDYLAKLDADAHVFPLIASLDERPFAYFEIYWAKEDRIAPFSDAGDYDRGWHVLVGEEQCRGQAFVSAWMPSISHYLFLDDPRTQRLLIEPRSDNRKMLRSLDRSGYALLKEFDFPHKRAMLGMVSRERFFSEQLWIPRPASVT